MYQEKAATNQRHKHRNQETVLHYMDVKYGLYVKKRNSKYDHSKCGVIED